MENESDTQQLQLPLTVPLMVAYMIVFVAFRNPDGRYVLSFSALASSDRQKIQIKYKGQYLCLSLPLNTWSLTTVVIG